MSANSIAYHGNNITEAMKGFDMEDVVDLTEEIVFSYSLPQTTLLATETSQTQSTFDTDLNFILDAAEFTRLLSQPMSDVNSSILQDPEQDGCSPTPSLKVTGACFDAPNTPDNLRNSQPALLQLPLRISARRSTLATLKAQEGCDQDSEQRRRESSTASSVVQHFSDLTIAQSACFENTQYLPNPTLTTTLSSSPSVYFPPSASALHQKRRKAKRHEIRAPRPKNCFMLYRSKVLPMIMVELGSINNKIISKIAAERWRAESEPVKTWYRQMAKQGKEEHARNHPGYKYAPNKKLLAMASANGPTSSRTDRDYHSEARHHDDEDDDIEDDEMDAMNDSHGRRDQDAYQPDARRRSPRQGGVLGQSVPYDVSRSSSKRAKTSASVSSRHRRPRDGTARAVSGTESGFSDAQEYAMDPSSSLCVNDFYAAFPMSTLGYNSSVPSLPLMGSSLIEQQLYLQVQQPKSQPKSQQAHTPLLQDQDHLQAAMFYTNVPSVSSFYGLAEDMNASSSTLVDPVNNWMTHRYQDASTLFEHLDLSDVNKVAYQCNRRSNVKKTLDLQADMKGPMGMTHLMLDKDLPPLPLEISVQDSCFDTPSSDDPQMILSHLYAEYNNPGQQQEFPLQLLTAKECEPYTFSIHDDGFGFDAKLSHPTVSDGLLGHHQQQHQQQQLQLQQQQQHPLQQRQQQQYLIKPAYPTGFMSFTDVGEGAFSTMDMFTWPSQP
ncbi:hypothetical protein BGZ68_007958 [Mortierella alpina]|nr:hypothetical protein BGZ68_007958 [Mortierella alpina]